MTTVRRFRPSTNIVVSVILAVAGVLGAGAIVSTIAAQESNPKTRDEEKRLAAGEREAKKMLLLKDTGQSGKISKQEFVSFMEAEFERLDTNKDGELDVKELTNSRVQVRTRGR